MEVFVLSVVGVGLLVGAIKFFFGDNKPADGLVFDCERGGKDERHFNEFDHYDLIHSPQHRHHPMSVHFND